MFFLNLSAAEFFALFGVLGGLTAALYLLDRTKRKKIVSTLRFWMAARTAEEQQSRRRMHEPWSLVLQLLGLLFLLLAIAQLQWGARQSRGRDHVLLLDTSAWSAGELGKKLGNETVLDREKSLTRRYLSALPSVDRAMLVRVDAMATPVTPFTANRAPLLDALNQSASAWTALNLEQALSLAKQAQSWSGGQPGEIVYFGAALLGDEPNAAVGVDQDAPNLRTILVPPSRENVGIRHLGVKRGEEDSNSWQATVTLKNYGSIRRTVRLRTQFAGTVFAPRTLNLVPAEETAVEYNFVTNTSGELIAELEPLDSLRSDDRAVLRLPKNGALRVAVFTRRPETLGPLLAANHRLSVKFYGPSQYTPTLPAQVTADVVVLDQFAASPQPRVATLWIDPPREQSPLPVKSVVTDAIVKNWHADTALGAGLRAKEAHFSSAEVFQTFEGDRAVASVAEGPIVVARPSANTHPKLAVIGFDPLNGELKFQVTTPLLFANLLRWLSPEAFRTLDLSAGRVGAVNVALEPSERADRIRVSDDQGFAVPFTIHSQTLQLFASRPGVVRVLSDDRERVLSLTLPDVAEFEWKPPAGAAHDIPPVSHFAGGAIDLWKWLALCGAACLLVEWFLYGRQRRFAVRRPTKSAPPATKPESAKARELVSK